MPRNDPDGDPGVLGDGTRGGPAVGTRPGPRLPRGRGTRIAVSTVFFVNGAAFATWAARVPAIRDALALSPGDLSLALTGLAAGAFLGLPLAGGLVARWGSRRVLACAAPYLAALPLIAFAPRLVYLIAVLAAFAIGNSALDVAMNTQGALVERACARPLMGGFHAMFSLGGVAGAAAGGLAATAGMGVGAHFLLAAAVLAAVCGGAAVFLLPDGPAGGGSDPLLALPSRGLWAPGFVVFCALMGEGLMNDWGSIYLRDIAGSSAGTAAAGFGVFSVGMVGGRLAADRIRGRTTSSRFLLTCGLIAASGSAVAIAFPATWTGLAAYCLIGLGLAAVVPVAFSHAASLTSRRPGPSIAAVSTIGYIGFMAGPPLVGGIAESTGLRTAMLVFLLLMVTMACLAPALSREP
ncbi:MFS transporter [Actinomadura rubrisoli]|uniref:MFS transporter n=1 Tax=Actinomadura rubrisoli TaxID=2530368 RepID=A0A4V6PEN7_9ACTN|nr:MFS transporter [Actinomadura rubrisoli]TDD75707.1 MFS transporter [Actinomadura rubrisoli]